MYVNYRYKRKERDVAGTDGKVILPTYQHRLRYRLTYSPDYLQLRTTGIIIIFIPGGRKEARDISLHNPARMLFLFP